VDLVKMQQWVRLINETMNVNSRIVLKSKHLLRKKSANEKLGVAIELWPGSLWRVFPFVEWGGALYRGALHFCSGAGHWEI